VTSAIGSLRRAFEAGCALFVARAEFAAAELGQARDATLVWIAVALLAAVLLALALVGVSATIIMILWDRFGWHAMAAMTALYGLLAAWLILKLVRRLRDSEGLLPQTLAELSKDRDAVFVRRPASDKTPT
jgi:uncharacterized membrane protein YqjE